MYDYVKQARWARLKVGLVITIAVVVIFLAVMFAGNIEKMFAPRIEIHASFDDVKGLREGSPVWFSGVEIGAVKDIQFTIQRHITVSMIIFQDTLQYLKKDSMAQILTLGLLGDKYIEISTGSKEAAGLQIGDTLLGTGQIEIQDVVETGQESIASFGEFISMLEGFLSKIERGDGTVAKFIQDPAVYNNLRKATSDLSKLISKIDSGQGSISRLLNEDAFYKDITVLASEMKSFAEKLQTSEGSLNRMIEDRSLYDNIDAVSERMNNILARIESGQGFMGSLIQDDELAGELKTTLRELNSLIKDVRENPRKYFKFSVF
ncbi:MAG: MCE family protein [Nitrospiraceae bacterium]|nr:MAG: MCE family protein [Nitrospiraceae bacterium]